jgi:hypothetical protein
MSAPRFTVEDAFSPCLDPHGHFSLERSIRAVAFLLNWTTENGNRSLDGNAAAGLGRILDRIACEAARLGERAEQERRAAG